MSAADTIRDALKPLCTGNHGIYPGTFGKSDCVNCLALVALVELEAELERLTVGRATLEDQTNRAELAEAQRDALVAALRKHHGVNLGGACPICAAIEEPAPAEAGTSSAVAGRSVGSRVPGAGSVLSGGSE